MSRATSRIPDAVRHREVAQLIAIGAPRSAAAARSTRVSACRDRQWERHVRRAPAQRYTHQTPALVCGNFWVAEGPPPQFVIACKQCARQLMTVVRITDPEIARLEAHIRACVRPDPLGETPALGVLMAQIRVTARRA